MKAPAATYDDPIELCQECWDALNLFMDSIAYIAAPYPNEEKPARVVISSLHFACKPRCVKKTRKGAKRK